MSVAASAAVGPPPGMAVRLSSNESPFGPSPQALAAAEAALRQAHRYPDDASARLRAALATDAGVAEDEVAVGTGSAAVLMDLIAAAAPPGSQVVAFARSFVVARLAAHNAGAAYLEVPTGGPATHTADGYARDVEALLAAIGPGTSVVYVDNPGNPTGAHLTGEQLTALVDGVPEQVTVVVDEAYHDVATGRRGYATVGELGLEHPRLAVTRTFSKAHALAALRVGWVVGAATLVGASDARRPRFNVTATGQAAALASLADREHLRGSVTGMVAGRERLAAGLRELGVPVTAGLGNFVTVELGTASGPVVDAFAARGVGVRPLEPYRMLEQVRVSVGTPEEVETFLAVAREVLAEVPSRS